MRHVYLIAYDITDPKRYRPIYRAMCGHGDALQYSVFRCELSEVELQKLKDLLWPVLDLEKDRVMIVDLGSLNGRGEECIEFWGVPKVIPAEREATIV